MTDKDNLSKLDKVSLDDYIGVAGKPRGRQKGWRKRVKFGENEDLTTVMVTCDFKERLKAARRKPGERLGDTISRLIIQRFRADLELNRRYLN